MLLALVMASAVPARAQTEIDMYHIALPGLIEADGVSGPVGAVLREISDRSGVRFNRMLVPMNRLIRDLQRDIPALGVPQLGPMITKRFGDKVTISPPMVFRRDFAFVRMGTPIPRTIDEIRPLVIVVAPTTVLPPPLARLDGLSILDTHSDVSAIRLVSRGRADVWVNDETNTLDAIRKAGVTNVVYDSAEPFHVWPGHIVYSQAVDEALRARIDRVILEMADDGTLERLLPRNYTNDYGLYLSSYMSALAESAK